MILYVRQRCCTQPFLRAWLPFSSRWQLALHGGSMRWVARSQGRFHQPCESLRLSKPRYLSEWPWSCWCARDSS
jgi:hypothetical protein